MLHLRQAPYSLSLIAVIRLLSMLAADERRNGQSTQSEEAALADLGPEAALQAQLGRPLTKTEMIRLRQQSGDFTS